MEIAGAYKKFSLALATILKQAKREERALGRNPTSEDQSQIAKRVISQRDELVQRFDSEIIEIDSRYKPLPESNLCFPYLGDLAQPHSPENESRLLFRWLHWERHHESAEKAEEADRQGDISAWDRLARTARDWRTIIYKKGAIKPFQGGSYHQDIFQFGLSFASGMDKLMGEELAGFFDSYCPCGKTHDVRALQRQLARLLKDLEAAARKS
jgi:hypothetical protein